VGKSAKRKTEEPRYVFEGGRITIYGNLQECGVRGPVPPNESTDYGENEDSVDSAVVVRSPDKG
jgi:hypothetical protein